MPCFQKLTAVIEVVCHCYVDEDGWLPSGAALSAFDTFARPTVFLPL